MKQLQTLAGLLSILMVLIVTTIVAGLIWFSHEFQKPGPHNENKTLIIQNGHSLHTITSMLFDAQAISHAMLFKVGVKANGAATELKAGEYDIPAKASMQDILTLLRSGKTVAHSFTIPEGKTSFEIVRILNKVEGLSGEILIVPAEGTLLPETYHFTRSDARTDKLQRMQKAMIDIRAELTKDWTSDNKPQSLSILCQKDAPQSDECWRHIITLASIVEKETGVAKERAKVARVFLNRLEIDMALQTDPTVIYAMTRGEHKEGGKGPLGRRLLRKDLQIDDPYNTYKYPGLPPGPIANPGRASIEAVLSPEEHGYFYFVADGTGGHAFGKTLQEHNANVAKWRKIRRASEN